MRKLMLLAAMLAMVLVAAAPALAQDPNAVAVVDQDQAAAIVQECNTIVNVAANQNAEGGDATGVQNADLDQLQNQEANLQAAINQLQQTGIGQGQYGVVDVDGDGIPDHLEKLLEKGLITQAQLAVLVELGTVDAQIAELQAELTQVQDQIAAIEQGQNVEGGDAGNAVTIGDITVTGAECQAIINQVAQGEAKAVAVAEVVDLVKVVTVVDGVDNDGDGIVDEADEAKAADDQYVVEAADDQYVVEAADDQYAAEAEVADVAVLPDTGGATLFTLGAGALLVGGGLLARRIFR